eukprot:Skav205022  [mRNA]  locus=scaffold1026:292214:296509:- [translate_table: standard]
MYYADPVKMDATERTVELSAELCQQRCQDGGCLLTGEASYAKATPFKYSATTSGPKFCPGTGERRKSVGPLLFLFRLWSPNMACLIACLIAIGDVTLLLRSVRIPSSSAIQDAKDAIAEAESAWAAGDDDKSKTEAEVVAVSPGVNGTMCSAYPACVDVGIKERSQLRAERWVRLVQLKSSNWEGHCLVASHIQNTCISA